VNREQVTVRSSTRTLVVARYWLDLQMVFIGALLLVLLFSLHVTDGLPFILRSILGLIYVLYVPGYCLVQAVFPAPGDLDGLARAGASIGLSAVVTPLLALALDQTATGLKPWPILGADLGFIGICSALAMVQRVRRTPDSRCEGREPGNWWSALSPRVRVTLIALTVFFLAITSVGVTLVHRAMTSYATEFYILGQGNQAQQYPLTGSAGSIMSVTVGIMDQDQGAQRYHVEVWLDDQNAHRHNRRVAQTARILLKRGQQTQFPVTWRLPWGSQNEKVDLRLFVDNGAQPYRELWLYLNP
jgi:uncharacterized membrane protein